MSNIVPGILFNYLAIAVLLAIPASLALLAWYRHAVRSGMRERSAAAATATAGVSPTAEARTTGASGTTEHAESRLRIRIVSIYALAAVAASAVTTYLYFQSPDIPFSALRAFTMGHGFYWPLAPTLAVLLALSLRQTLLLALAYYLAGAAVIFLWSMFSLAVLGHDDVSPFGNVRGYTVFLMTVAFLPFVIILITGSRKVRPVTPLVLAGLLVFSFAALLIQAGFITLLDSATVRDVLLPFRHSEVLWFMLAALPVGFACWLALRALSRRFEAKTFSDTQLLADTWWLIAAFSNSVFLANDLQWRGLLALLAFAAYRATVAVGQALWPIDAAMPGPQRLLLLRVFGYQRRTERLFDAIAQRWRLSDSVNMIAGADLAGRTIDPGDIVTFAGGHLRDQFVKDGADLQRRLNGIDEARDPDGRFRINEFFCYDNTWRPTLESLLLRSDAVLMDIRSFSRSNSGCLFELQKLAEHRKLDCTLFVVDGNTDVDLLRGTLTQAAKDVAAETGPAINLEQARKHSGGELQRIFASLRALSA